MCFSRRRSIALSSCQGRFVAASTNTSSFDFVNPSICTRSSVLSHRLASCSLDPSPLWLIRASISSKKMVLGARCLASSNSTFTSFSESPRHLLTMEEAEMLKKVVLHSVATASASIVLPVPGGPKSRIPFHGVNRPVKYCGYLMGITTASLRRRFAFSKPLILLHCTSKSPRTMSRVMLSANSRISMVEKSGNGFIHDCLGF
jgi:hypothetical protein